MFVLVSEPHRQNDRGWALVSPNKVAACKKTTGTKCMAWTGMVNCKCLPVVWFEGSVNGQVYLELLQNTLWPAVRASATRKQFWYQHDGAPCDSMPGIPQIKVLRPHLVSQHEASLASKFTRPHPYGLFFLESSVKSREESQVPES